MRYLLLITFLFACIGNLRANDFDLEKEIKSLFPNAEITKSDPKYHYTDQYEILIDQYIDHENKEKGTFRQRLFLSHHDYKKPMLFVTEGYVATLRHYELTEILNSNQLIVEYRFFGKSVPADKNYDYLTNQQAVEDLHRINKKFKKIYKKEWVSTGISKGGTTCMYYKATYPKDVCVAVPYVAPLPAAREDIRTDNLIASIGEEACRDKLFAFQRHALSIQDSLLAYAQKDAKENALTFTRINGIEKAIEYAILEYTFSYWQMGHTCDEVPENPTPKETYAGIKNMVGIDFYSDGVIAYFEPAFYQFMTQNGYYGFMADHLKDLLKHVTVFDNAIFAPRDVSLDYDPSYNIWVKKRLIKKGKRMIIIQGENDPWGALTFVPKNTRKALLMILPGGSHRTRIKDFGEADREKIYNALRKWLKAEIYPLKDDDA